MKDSNDACGLRRRVRVAIAILAMGFAASRAPFVNATPWWHLDGGDINGDGATDLADPIALLGYLFAGGPAPSPCGPCEPIPGERVPPWGPVRSAGAGKGDVDANGAMDLADPVRLLMYLFNSGPAPESCGVCWPCGPKPLPATGQKECWGVPGEKVPCDDPEWLGEDGYYQVGCPEEGRFVDNGDGTVTDTCTGLMWEKETGVPRWHELVGPAVTRLEAFKYCDRLVLGAYEDWRIPSPFELHSLFELPGDEGLIDEEGRIRDVFPSVFPPVPEEGVRYHHGCYWTTSFTLSGHIGIRAGGDLVDGEGYVLVRCVRGGLGPCGSRIPSMGSRSDCLDPATGEEVSCDDPAYQGQDAAFRAGCPLDGRFVDNGDGTVTDRCTGLMWEKETASPGPEYAPTKYGEMNFRNALRYARGLRLGGYEDWRIPNIRELFFLATSDPRARVRLDLFPFEFPVPDNDGKPVYRYWSSTVAPNGNDVCIMDRDGADLYGLGRYDNAHALLRCVRGPIDLMGER